MARKQLNNKQESDVQTDVITAEEVLECEGLPSLQTDMEERSDEVEFREDLSPNESVPQTDIEAEGSGTELGGNLSPDGSVPQTDTEIPFGVVEADPMSDENRDEVLHQAETEMSSAGDETDRKDPPIAEPGNEPLKAVPTPRRKRKTAADQSDREARRASEDTAEEMPDDEVKKGRSAKRRTNVLTIDGERTVETEADKARNDLIDLTESLKTGRILSGTIQGVERPNGKAGGFAVIYHGAFKIIVPAEEAVEPPDDLRDQTLDDVLHYLLTKRLGAEVDYIVKGIDANAGIAVASRLDAMRVKRREYYFGSDRDGNNLIYPGLCAEARVVSVIRAGIFIDLFGLEVYIPLRELSYQRIMDAAGYFQPGQRILVKVTAVDRSDRNQVKAAASVKQAAENPYEKALRMYAEGNRYVGTVSMVDTNGVFVALDGGIDCLCSYPKRGRPPRGARVTVRILGINHESNRIWGAITHIATPR